MDVSSGTEQLMGGQPGQLNLRAQRQRAQDLAERIDSLVDRLKFAPDTVRFSDIADTMAVLNVQLHQLQEELRPVCHHYVLHPKSVNAQNAATLPVMLASMPYPEQQARFDEVLGGAMTEYEEWKIFLEGLSLGNTRKGARRRGAGGVSGGDGVQGRAPGGLAPPPLNDAELELLDLVGFGGLGK
mmetsp:Transcript_1272/g.4165  ORF Transcript_1272/g.4165 Transcript_1272/m.4165 type:complete len:185 (+) Transcript_1272:5192-5746(+)